MVKDKMFEIRETSSGYNFFSYDHESEYRNIKISAGQRGKPKIPKQLKSL